MGPHLLLFSSPHASEDLILLRLVCQDGDVRTAFRHYTIRSTLLISILVSGGDARLLSYALGDLLVDNLSRGLQDLDSNLTGFAG